MANNPWHTCISSDELHCVSTSRRSVHRKTTDCSARFIIGERNKGRKAWDLLVFLLLFYTATVLPFRLCFIEFRIPTSHPCNKDWIKLEYAMDVLFVFDLILPFFFSYRDRHGKEVVDPWLIARRYLCSYFVLNFIACVPFEQFDQSSQEGESSVNKGLRLTRMQRMTRLIRLLRLLRLTKLVRIIVESPVWHYVQSLRGVRIVNFFCALTFAVHIFACFWYICAALHEDHMETWVARRIVWSGGLEVPLVEKGPIEQWGNAMYFVLTVFTTVGFGDMSALTPGEIFYVCLTMVAGAVVNSLILSEVITVITTVDQKARNINDQLNLVADFALHTQLDRDVKRKITEWVSTGKGARSGFDRARMKDLLTSSALPRAVIAVLPRTVFQGELYENKFVQTASVGHMRQIPNRLPLFIALEANLRYFDVGEVVYNYHDTAWNVFLALQGTFAYVGHPSPTGGNCAVSNVILEDVIQSWWGKSSSVGSAGHDELLDLSPYRLFGRRSYFGEVEVVTKPSSQRNTYARCESGGCLLVLNKDSVFELMNVFPPAAEKWCEAAERSQHHTMQLLSRLTHTCNYKQLASQTIQRFVRRVLFNEIVESASNCEMMRTDTCTRQTEKGFGPHTECIPQGVMELSARVDARIDGLCAEIKGMRHSMQRQATDMHAILQYIRRDLPKLER